MTEGTAVLGRSGDLEAPSSSRATVPDLPTSRPIAERLPALFQEDDLCVRLTEALDVLLAPVYLVLDSLDAYVDPGLAPEDFLSWLAGWVGLLPEDLRDGMDTRALVGEATSLFSLRGTPAGLARLLELASGRPVLLEDSGGVRWSQTPESELPGSSHPFLTVRLGGSPISSSEERTLRRMLHGATPAHVPATLVFEREPDPAADGLLGDGVPGDGGPDLEPDGEAPGATARASSDHEHAGDEESDLRDAGDAEAGRSPDDEERPEQ